MSALTKFFFRHDVVTPPTTSQTIAWWESRRLPYNLAVGAAGLVSMAITNLFCWLPPHSSPMPWQANLIVPVIYGTLANVFYSFGWGAELTVRKWLGDEMSPVGPAIFRYGFAFSIGLTLFPTILAFGSWLIRVIVSIAGAG
ncbi:MAG: hypothetical protein U0163_03315 [Gemmatimonadaceae bacterium]